MAQGREGANDRTGREKDDGIRERNNIRHLVLNWGRTGSLDSQSFEDAGRSRGGQSTVIKFKHVHNI